MSLLVRRGPRGRVWDILHTVRLAIQTMKEDVADSALAANFLEERRGISCGPDAKLSLGVVDVIFDGARRYPENDCDITECLVLGRQRQTLSFPAGQMDTGEREYGFQLVARMAVELIGDSLQAKGVTTGDLEERRALHVSGESKRREPAMPVMNGDGVAVTDTETRRLVEETTCERVVSPEVTSPSEWLGLADAVQNNGITGLIALIDVVPSPGIGVVGNEAQLPACR